MSTPLDDEIRGDWNNLKGTDYHLVYVLWLLLCRNARFVAFYRGNDLLANLVPTVRVQDLEEDEWIQLKATRDPWTVTTLLKENLLLNFIMNALTSEAGGRTWRTRLVTQGEIRKETIESFAKDPASYPDSNSKLTVILNNAQQRLQQERWQQIDQFQLRLIALRILQQIAQEEPLPLRQMKAEVDLQLAYRYLIPGAVQQAGNTLLGSLLRDSAGGPIAAHVYDNAWLDEIAGTPLKSLLPFDSDPVSACDQAVQAVYNSPSFHWEASRCVIRTRVENELQHFLQSSEIVFVMLGMSGTGKSWVVADWAGRIVQGRARLLIPGSDLYHAEQRVLSHLVAQHLRIFTSAPISDENILARLRAFARIKDKGPLVLVIDGLQPTGDTSVFRHDLERIVEQCRAAEIKLVLTAQTHIWEYYRLGQNLLLSDIYQIKPEVTQGDERTKTQQQNASSFTLTDFTPEEQEIALRQRLPTDEGQHLSRLFRTTIFAPLRRPYLLELYLEQHQENIRQQRRVPINIDTLLDSRLKTLLLQVATLLNADEQDITDAFHTLYQQLWMARPNGLSNVDAEAHLEPFFGNRSHQVLDTLRQMGVLTTRGRVRFAETPLAERVSARRLSGIYLNGNEDVKDSIVQQLRLEEDTGVVSALLRSLAHEDPITFAERLLKCDPKWVTSIAEGLAQCSPQDYRVLAFLSSLTRHQEDAFVVAGCTALGQLAAQNATEKSNIVCMQRAFNWLVQIYVSERRKTRLNGSHALGVMLDFAPERAEIVIRFRVKQILQRMNEEKEQRAEKLYDAFMPLLRINHKSAAYVGSRLLARYSSLFTSSSHASTKRLLQEADEVRGNIALFEPSGFESILSDLHSQEANNRRRAALALRSIMFEQPERILDDICDAIRDESDKYVMNQLLWATFRLIEIAPDKLLNALVSSSALDWSIPSPSVGQALATLSNLAQLLPKRIIPLLPEQLNSYDTRSRAWLSEGLAFAWWACAEYSSEVRDQLSRLAVPDIAGVPADFKLFAYRGAIIAQLGLACLDIASTKELQSLQTPYPETEMQFFFVNTATFVQSHALALIRQTHIDQLLDLLLRCLVEESQTLVHPLQKTLFRAHNICTHFCMEMLISLAIAHSDPTFLLDRLPRNWRLVYAVRRLIDAGRREAIILSFARELCNAPVAGSDVQELGEREQLLAQLVNISEAPIIALKELQASLPALPFTADDRADAFAGLAETRLENMLDLLNQIVESEDSLPALYQWGQKARSWQGLLIAKVYERMFDARSIYRIEAYELCEQMLTAVHALPESELQQEYLLVYSTIAQWLKEKLPLNPDFAPSSSGEAIISRSHAFAFELLQQNFPRQIDEQELGNRLLDMLATGYGKGWWKGTGIALKEDIVSLDSSNDLIYVFPAVRLALIALEAVNTELTRDIASQFLEQRGTVRKIIAEYRWHLDTNDQETLQSFLNDLDHVDYMTKRDERIPLYRGLVLIKLGRLPEAEEELNHCLAMPSFKEAAQAEAYYNLACIYALTKREELCRTMLTKAVRLWPQFRQNMVGDPDFVSVQDSMWFQLLLNDKPE